MTELLKAIMDFCDAADVFAYQSELPHHKELRRAAERLHDTASEFLQLYNLARTEKEKMELWLK